MHNADTALILSDERHKPYNNPTADAWLYTIFTYAMWYDAVGHTLHIGLVNNNDYCNGDFVTFYFGE